MVTRGQLLDEVWGPGTNVTDRVVDNQVNNLRKKIEPVPDRPRYLIALRGLGYRFDGEGMTEPDTWTSAPDVVRARYGSGGRQYVAQDHRRARPDGSGRNVTAGADRAAPTCSSRPLTTRSTSKATFEVRSSSMKRWWRLTIGRLRPTRRRASRRSTAG